MKWTGWGGDIKAVADAVKTNAEHSQQAADSASMSVAAAVAQADWAMGYRNAAAASATSASTSAASALASNQSIQEGWIGGKPSHPAVDNLGRPVRVGAAYGNTTDKAWYWFDGANWQFGRGDPASVDWSKVLNKPATVSGFGILDWKIESAGNADLNTVIKSGVYRCLVNANAPYDNGLLFVARGLNIISQTFYQYNTGRMLIRTAYGISDDFSTTQVWTTWKSVAYLAETPVETSGVMDCSATNYFTIASAASPSLSFTNVPAGAYSCVLEIYLASGSVVLPPATLLNEPAPTIAAGKRYLLFFQKSGLVSNRWWCSVLQYS